MNPTPPPPSARRGPIVRVAVLLAVLLAAATAALLWPKGGAPVATEDPFAFSPPDSRPAGAPIPLRTTLAAGDRFQGSGTIFYRQSGGGHFGGMPTVPERELSATFTFVRRVEGTAGSPLRSTVEAKVAYRDTVDRGVPVDKSGSVTLTFEHGHADTSSLPSTKLLAPDDLRPALVIFAEAFTQRTPLVGLDPRSGEAFVPKAAMDVEPLRRQAFKLFNFNERGLAPVEGAVWLDDVRGGADSAEATVRTWIRHAQSGKSGNPLRAPIATDYATVVRGLYRVGIRDGLAHRVELSDALRTHYKAPDFDYHAEFRRAVTFDEAKAN